MDVADSPGVHDWKLLVVEALHGRVSFMRWLIVWVLEGSILRSIMP
jgi:hypothetical protein